MDEQRLQEYVQLIGLLLQCLNGEEGEILQAHADLVDLGLLLTMQTVAEELSERGDTNTAEWLENLAAEQSGKCLQRADKRRSGRESRTSHCCLPAGLASKNP